MIEIRRILCPIDFSDFSRRALDHALAIANWYESTITVLHVFSTIPLAPRAPGPMALDPLVLTDADREELLAEVRRFVGQESSPGIGIESMVYEGSTAEAILGQAATMAADLIVMGSHGRSGFERVLLGSITEKVLRKAMCPVLTVPRGLPDAVPAGPVLFKQILCAVDFSHSSMRALNYALSLAQEADAHLAVVHVSTPELDHIPDISVSGAHVSVAAYQRQWEDDVRQRLKEAVPDEAATYCSVESLMVRGKPWREILRLAAERGADLIVMGVQGRGAVDLMLFGSTTQHVVRGAACPVLTLRQNGTS